MLRPPLRFASPSAASSPAGGARRPAPVPGAVSSPSVSRAQRPAPCDTRRRLRRGRYPSDRRSETLRSWLRRAYVICGGGRSLGQAPLGRRPRRRGCLRRRRIGGTSCTGTAAGTTSAATPFRRPPPRRRDGATRPTTRRHRPSVTTRDPHLAVRRHRPPQKFITDRAAAPTSAPTLMSRSATRPRALTGTGWTTTAAVIRLSAGMAVEAAPGGTAVTCGGPTGGPRLGAMEATSPEATKITRLHR